MTKTERTIRGRRTFLKGAVVAGGAATTVAVAGSAIADMADVEVAQKNAPAAEPQGYRETKHVSDYYRLARF